MGWTCLDDLLDWTPKTGSRSMETITTYSTTVPLKRNKISGMSIRCYSIVIVEFSKHIYGKLGKYLLRGDFFFKDLVHVSRARIPVLPLGQAP